MNVLAALQLHPSTISTVSDLQSSIVSFRPGHLTQGVAPNLPTQSGNLGLGLM